MIMYKVSEIYDTISGEAPTAGEEATFVRLDGCPVRCIQCDTLYSVVGDTIQYKRGYLIGVRWGDGHIDKRGVFQLNVGEQVFADLVSELIGDVFNITAPRVFTRLAGPKSFSPGSVNYRVYTGVKKVGRELSLLPRTVEERRGFVAGFFDAEGCLSYVRTRKGKSSRWELSFSNKRESLLEIVGSGLSDWGFRYGMDHDERKSISQLRLRARTGTEIQKLPWQQRKQVRDHEGQRFFDVFRPRLERKYGKFLLRWRPEELSGTRIASRCSKKLVVITGGEPLMWDLDILIRRLWAHSHRVQVETSGAYEFKGVERPDILVCSPKPNMQYHVAASVKEAVTIYKLVNGPQGSGFDWSQTFAESLSGEHKPIYVMPFGAPPTNEAKDVTKTLAEQNGWLFSPRLHFELGVP